MSDNNNWDSDYWREVDALLEADATTRQRAYNAFAEKWAHRYGVMRNHPSVIGKANYN